MAFTLPDLPYAHDALAALGMSRETLEYHHDLHHKAYVDNGNKLIAGTEWDGKTMEEIIVGTYNKTAVAQNGIFNNISQLWNHNQFWEMMGPGENKMPGDLEKALTESFGSVAAFKEAFSAAGAGQFGSGWCWLVKNADGGGAGPQTPKAVEQRSSGQTPRAVGLRCVGAQLLHRLSQQAACLPCELPRQSRQLGKRRGPDVIGARSDSPAPRRGVFLWGQE